MVHRSKRQWFALPAHHLDLQEFWMKRLFKLGNFVVTKNYLVSHSSNCTASAYLAASVGMITVLITPLRNAQNVDWLIACLIDSFIHSFNHWSFIHLLRMQNCGWNKTFQAAVTCISPPLGVRVARPASSQLWHTHHRIVDRAYRTDAYTKHYSFCFGIDSALFLRVAA